MDDFISYIEQSVSERPGTLETGQYNCTLKRVKFYDTPFPKARFYFEYDGAVYCAEAPITKRDGSKNLRSVKIISTVLMSNRNWLEEAKHLQNQYKEKGIDRVPTFDVLSSKTLDLDVIATIETCHSSEYKNSYLIDLKVL
jgi:hypothetical protein